MNADVVFVRKQNGAAANNWRKSAAAAIAMATSPSTTSTDVSNPPKDNFVRKLFRRGNMAPAVAPQPQQEPMQTRTYKEKYDEIMQRLKNSSGMIYFIIGIIVSFVFITVGGVLMAKKKSGQYPYCQSDNCYATTDGHGRFILSDATHDPYMNEHSSYLTGVVLLFFGIACACLTLVVYFRKK